MSAISSDMSTLIAAHRLMKIARDQEARRNGDDVEEKSALEYMEEDQALISGAAVEAQQKEASAPPPIENVNVRLADLKPSVKKAAQPAAQEDAFAIVGSQSVEIKLEIRYRANTPLEGLKVYDQNYAESDRYLFKFADGMTFTILDKWTNKSTTIWGDPHVDVNDVEGNNNGDFQDLKKSDDFTTLMLSDGTRVTFKAKDAGVIEQVDIFKGGQHVRGVGQAAKGFTAEAGLFNPQVLSDGISTASATQLGDIVHAGGDGNDWFDSSGKLVWGKTTAPIVIKRPSATLELYYKQTVSQSLAVSALKADA